MRKAIILYNPSSGGRRRQRRLAEVESALSVLRAAGVETTSSFTRSSTEAGAQAREAIAAGCDTVFACGGDGTVHDVTQGMVGTDAALGILPTGTANALAHDLGLPLSPSAAAQAAIKAQPRSVALGHVKYQDFSGNPASHYFIVAAGLGVDAHLFYKLNAGIKQRMGMMAYYTKATHLWLTHPMRHFLAEFVEAGATGSQRAVVSELLAVRIRNFGGVLRELAPGASLERNDLRLVLFRTTNRLSYLLYIIRGMLGRTWNVPGIDLVHSEKVVCQSLPESRQANGTPRTHSRVYVEVDGELLGTLPAEITVVPEALTILVP